MFGIELRFFAPSEETSSFKESNDDARSRDDDAQGDARLHKSTHDDARSHDDDYQGQGDEARAVPRLVV